MERFIADRAEPFPFPLAYDERREARRLLRVDRPPTFALIDGRGILRGRGEGFGGTLPLD